MTNDLQDLLIARHRNGAVQYHPAGRFMVRNGVLTHLADYHGLMGDILPEGPMDLRTINRIENLPAHSSYFALRRVGAKPPAVQQPSTAPQTPLEAPAAVRPAGVFHYQRVGHDKPHVVEFRSGNAMLDGNPLTANELATIGRNVREGVAILRRHDAKSDILKAERTLQKLLKAVEDDVMDPQQALQHLDQAVAGGHVPAGVAESLRRHIFQDPMTEGIGNKYAYQQFRSKPRPGIHIVLDGNGMKAINDTHGHDAGDAAIKSMGRAIRDSVDEVVGRDKAKAFRAADTQSAFRQGGDEFSVHVPTPEHAHQFARALQTRLDQVPPIGGTHKLSVSMGFGHTPETADKALYEAKKQKVGPNGQPAFAPHQMPHFVHSLVPGQEGPVPLSQHRLPLVRPQAPGAPAPAAEKPAV